MSGIASPWEKFITSPRAQSSISNIMKLLERPNSVKGVMCGRSALHAPLDPVFRVPIKEALLWTVDSRKNKCLPEGYG